MHAEGMSIEQIARQFGVSRQRISNLLRRRPA
jgi:transcriptional regulator with XRE-family HTH domain